MLHLKGIGGIFILYKGYVEANLTIPDLPQYNEDVLFLIVANHKYGDKVLVQTGTQVIDQIVAAMTKKELHKAGETWKWVHLGTTVSKTNALKGLYVPKYNLERVKGKIFTMREVVIPPFGTTVVKGIANFTTHSKCLSVLLEAVAEYSEHITMARSYGVLRRGKGKINVCLRSHSTKQVTLLKWSAVGEIAVANIIPALLAPKPTWDGVDEKETTAKKGKLKVKKNY